MTHPIRRAVASLAIALTLWAPGAFAQAEEPPTIDRVEAALAELASSTEPSAKGLAETYEATLTTLRAAQAAASRAEQFAAEADAADNLLRAVKDDLAETPEAPVAVDAQELSLPELKAAAASAEGKLGAARTQVEELRSISELRTERKVQLPVSIAQTEQALAQARETLAATPAAPGNEAQRDLLLAKVSFQSAELDALNAERGSYVARADLLPLRRDRAGRDLALAEATFAELQASLSERRQKDGETKAADADRRFKDAVKKFPVLAALAAKNEEISELRSGEASIPRQLEAAEAALAKDKQRLNETRSRFTATARRARVGGLTQGTGFVLRRDFEWLPREAMVRADIEARSKALSKAQLQLLLVEDDRNELSNIDAKAKELVADLGDPEALALAQELLALRRDSLNDVKADLDALLETLSDHNALSQSLRAESAAYRDFIAQKILWVRSSPEDLASCLLKAPEHMRAIGGAVDWKVLAVELKTRAGAHFLFSSFILLAAAAVFLGRRHLRHKREEMGKRTRSYKTDEYVWTIRALIQTVLLALPGPLLAYGLAQLLAESAQELPRAAGHALNDIAFLWLTLAVLYGVLAEKSVGPVHFRWGQVRTRAVRVTLRWFMPLALPLAFIALTLDRQSESAWSDSVGRLAFVATMASLSVALHRLLQADSPLWEGDSLEKRDSLLSRTHRLWSLAATTLPLVLIALALAGYYYTALQFELRARYSLALALALVLINALLLRWLFITRRRLAVSQALEAREKKERGKEKAETGESGQAALDTEKVDIPAVDAQTRQLFRSSVTLATVLGLYLIWAATLPALKGLSRVQILPYPAIVSASDDSGALPQPLDASTSTAAASEAGQSAGAGTGMLAPIAPSAAASGAERDAGPTGIPTSLTLADLALASIFLLLTIVAARNLPALLELALLERLPLDGGSRYAVSTLLRYLILIIGVSAISGALGIGWQQIQWLAAALTFGLAFGLQEIFANFVSGIIILIERPVRVGDIVTVAGTEGRITQLRMRATTILDWDRKEYLVPNKEFITGNVVNWTLSDPITRVVITVGIAYGSDTAKARSLLLSAAKKCRLVLKDPGPTALFRRFGDSTLDFELRLFVENRDLWPQLIDQIHTAIDDAFRDAGIEIAFPQRDLHIRSAEGLGAGLRGRDDDTSGGRESP